MPEFMTWHYTPNSQNVTPVRRTASDRAAAAREHAIAQKLTHGAAVIVIPVEEMSEHLVVVKMGTVGE